MCYNKEILIITYFIGLSSSLLLITNKKVALKISGVFFLIVIQIQLMEYLFWKNNSCNLFNIELSNIGSVLNHIQPILLYLAILYFNKTLDEKKKNILNLVIGLYIIGLLTYSNQIYPLNCTIVTPESYPYLQWSWFYKKYATIFYLLFPITMLILFYIGIPEPYNLYLFVLCLGSLVGSYLIYNNKRASGNIWCWIAAFVPILLVITDLIYNI